jgi:hypothetical protein
VVPSCFLLLLLPLVETGASFVFLLRGREEEEKEEEEGRYKRC